MNVPVTATSDLRYALPHGLNEEQLLSSIVPAAEPDNLIVIDASTC
jgi:hypothetical protein